MPLNLINRGNADPAITLHVGELFLNLTNGHLWGGTAAGNQLLMGPGSVGGSVWVGDTPPSGPTQGTLWWDSVGCLLYIWYVDATSAQWVLTENINSTAPGTTNNIGRNVIHNPLMNVAQRGAGAFTALNAYTLDRWTTGGSTDTISIQQATLGDTDRSTIGDEAATKCLQNAFTGNSAAAAFNEINQRVEGVRRLAGKTVIFSFWALANSGTPKLGINVTQHMGTGGSPSGDVNALATGNVVTLGTTWARYSTAIAIPSAAGKTLGTNGDDYTMVRIGFSSGANANQFFGNIGVQAGTVGLWGIQLEVALPGQTQPSPLEKPDPRYDLANCQRFFATAAFTNGGSAAAGSAGCPMHAPFPVTMRAPPTITPTYSTQINCGSSQVYAVASPSEPGWGYEFYTVVTAGGNWALAGTFTASADL